MTQRRGLEGIRVLEVAGGVAAAYAAKLFADLGADVVRVEAQGRLDVVRERPFEAHRWFNSNKRSVIGDPHPLVAGADIVVHDLGPAAALAAGLDYETLSAPSPGLVVGAVSSFGSVGPYADFASTELTLIHGSSWGFLSPGASNRPDLAPLKAAGHHATLNTATVAALAILAAFERAERTGHGAFVDFSLYGAAARMCETSPATAVFQGADASRLGVKTLVPWGIYRCIGGLLQFNCVEEAQWRSLKALMGNPDWADMEICDSNTLRRDAADVVELYLSEWMATQDVGEVYRAGQEARLCVSPMNTMPRLEADEQLAARGWFATAPDGTKLVGPGFKVDQPWWALRRSAPAPGEHQGEGWLDRPERSLPAPTGEPGRPLDGVRVCDFTWIWAGPFCTQHLANLGADVIRLESPEHLCLLRRLPFNPPDHPLTPDTAGGFHLYNTDKRSVAIDLAHAEARAVVERLIALSDVVVDNFAVGTMANLGYGVEDVRRINPNAIVVSLTGYGQTGPSAGYMAYGPAGGALAGLYAATGYEGGDPMETGVAVGDPCTGLTGAWAVVAALSARRRNGEVARVDVAMAEAVAATVGELWMEYLSTGNSPKPAGNHDPIWAPHDCYPAQGEDRWVTIACPTEQSWMALCDVVDPALAADPRFGTAALRKTNEAALDEVLATWTAARDRWDVTRSLQSVGVAAFPSQSPLDLWLGDPQLAAIGLLEQPEHAVLGRRTVPGIPWRIHPGPNGVRRAAPALGQHTDEVLTDLLGFSADDVVRLRRCGALPG